jgi:hypothetical protein
MSLYKIVYITHYKDGTYISITTDKNLKLEEAINKANERNTHLWKFHQDKDRHSIHTVREMQ